MNDLQLMRLVMTHLFPTLTGEIHRPLHATGWWSADFRLGDWFLAVQWREGSGFEMANREDHGYGEGPDEVFPDFLSALNRVAALADARGVTIPPAGRK